MGDAKVENEMAIVEESAARFFRYWYGHPDMHISYNLDVLKASGKLPEELIQALADGEKEPEGTVITKQDARDRFERYFEKVSTVFVQQGWNTEGLREEHEALFYKTLSKKYSIVD